MIMILALRPGPGGDPETSAPTGCQPGDDVVVGWLRAALVLLSGRQRAGHFGVGPRPTVEKLAEPRAHSAASRSVTTQAENHMKATPRSALFQLNLVASSYPSWCGHHRVDSEIDLSPAQTISRKLGQHGGIILTGHWIEIDHTAPWHDTPDPHGGLADPQLAADPGVLDVRRGVAGVDKEWQPVISGCLRRQIYGLRERMGIPAACAPPGSHGPAIDAATG